MVWNYFKMGGKKHLKDPADQPITNFFQSEIFFKPMEKPTKSKSDEFFNGCVTEQLSQCTSDCMKKKIDLERVLASETKKLAELQSALSTCLNMCEKKESKIAELQHSSGTKFSKTKRHLQ